MIKRRRWPGGGGPAAVARRRNRAPGWRPAPVPVSVAVPAPGSRGDPIRPRSRSRHPPAAAAPAAEPARWSIGPVPAGSMEHRAGYEPARPGPSPGRPGRMRPAGPGVPPRRAPRRLARLPRRYDARTGHGPGPPGLARTRASLSPAGHREYSAPGRSDRHRWQVPLKPWGPADRSSRRTARTASAEPEVRPAPRPPTLRPHHRKTTQAGPEALSTSSLPVTAWPGPARAAHGQPDARPA